MSIAGETHCFFKSQWGKENNLPINKPKRFTQKKVWTDWRVNWDISHKLNANQAEAKISSYYFRKLKVMKAIELKIDYFSDRLFCWYYSMY